MIKKKPHTWPRRRMVKILDDPIRNFGPLQKKVANETVTEKPQVFERNFTLRAAENFSTRSIIDLWVCRRLYNCRSLQLIVKNYDHTTDQSKDITGNVKKPEKY